MKIDVNNIKNHFCQIVEVDSSQPQLQSILINRIQNNCQMVMNLISEEMSLSSINHKNEIVVGWKLNWTLSESNIHDNPFEAIKQLSSMRGRVFVVRNWDKIIRHPYFILKYAQWFAWKMYWQKQIRIK